MLKSEFRLIFQGIFIIGLKTFYPNMKKRIPKTIIGMEFLGLCRMEEKIFSENTRGLGIEY